MIHEKLFTCILQGEQRKHKPNASALEKTPPPFFSLCKVCLLGVATSCLPGSITEWFRGGLWLFPSFCLPGLFMKRTGRWKTWADAARCGFAAEKCQGSSNVPCAWCCWGCQAPGMHWSALGCIAWVPPSPPAWPVGMSQGAREGAGARLQAVMCWEDG